MHMFASVSDEDILVAFRSFAEDQGCDIFAAFKEKPENSSELLVRRMFLVLKPSHQYVIRSAAEAAAAMGD
jgi:hypothetical protein